MTDINQTWQEVFNREFTRLGMGTEICSYQDVDDIKQFISDFIAQTREETIREVLEELPELVGGTTPDQIAYESGYSFCRTTILNKLK